MLTFTSVFLLLSATNVLYFFGLFFVLGHSVENICKSCEETVSSKLLFINSFLKHNHLLLKLW